MGEGDPRYVIGHGRFDAYPERSDGLLPVGVTVKVPAVNESERPCRPRQDGEHERCLHPTGPNYDQDPFGQLVDHCCCDDLDRGDDHER